MHTTPDGQLKFLTPEIASGPTLSAEMLPMVEAEAAVHSMEELRRLFFSIVEHLRDTAERQLELNDNTAEVLGSSSSLAVDELGPLQSRQASLSQIAQQISAELSKQGATAQESAVEAGGEPASGPPSAEQAAALIKAAELVGQGEQAMSTAAQLMDSLASSQLPTSAVAPETNVNSTDQASALIKNGSDQDNESSRITAQQMTALEKLIEALAQLDEQESGESDQNQDQNSDNPENSEQPADSSDQEQQSASAEDNEREEQSQQRMSAAQMLQAIRDREAQRREEKNARQAVGSATVEKDW
jgi:hypothetical protein